MIGYQEYSDSVIRNWIDNKDKFGLIVAVRPSSESDDIVCVGFGLVQGQCKLPYEGNSIPTIYFIDVYITIS